MHPRSSSKRLALLHSGGEDAASAHRGHGISGAAEADGLAEEIGLENSDGPSMPRVLRSALKDGLQNMRAVVFTEHGPASVLRCAASALVVQRMCT
eukprot:scaffold3743_cov389-Prasinococcus_capsulatus_cf.AAC.9